MKSKITINSGCFDIELEQPPMFMVKLLEVMAPSGLCRGQATKSWALG